MAVVLWPRILNWGRETSGEIWTDLLPSFHLYLISAMVYPSINTYFYCPLTKSELKFLNWYLQLSMSRLHNCWSIGKFCKSIEHEAWMVNLKFKMWRSIFDIQTPAPYLMLQRTSPVWSILKNWLSVVAWWNSEVFSLTKNVSGVQMRLTYSAPTTNLNAPDFCGSNESLGSSQNCLKYMSTVKS